MNDAQRIVHLLDNLTPAHVRALPPAELRKFEMLCYHWHALASRWRDCPDSKKEASTRARALGKRIDKAINGKRRPGATA